MNGLIAGAIQGFGEGLLINGQEFGDYLKKSTLAKEAAEIQAQRDRTLNELARGNIEYAAKIQEESQARTEARRRETYSGAERAAQGLIEAERGRGAGGADTTEAALMGESAPARTVGRAQEERLRAQAYGEAGLPAEATRFSAAGREEERLTAEREEKGLDRAQRETEGARRERLDVRQHDERQTLLKRQVDQQAQQIGLENRKLKILEEDQGFDRQTKKLLQDARDAYMNEKEDPEKKIELGQQYLVLSGKATERWKAITDPMTGRVTGMFDQASGRMAGPEGRGGEGGTPSEAHVSALRERAKDPRAAAAFDAQYGQGAAARILQGAPQQAAKPVVRQDVAEPVVPRETPKAAGRSSAEFEGMLKDAKRGGTIGLEYIRSAVTSGDLTVGQRQRAQEALRGR